MDLDFAIGLMGQMFSMGLQIAAPILIVTLLAGVTISIFQVVTQIQEMTLTFVPKIFICIAVLYFAGNWMLSTLVAFARDIIIQAGSF
ncbi:flagellar biosynthetic protein FliQ [Agaribacter marinus]|uniref:Flagellar biosynthetic protein FliQ n=1 Tax=Agaribacter marinus TaxID=1431249 RepID=A0AA37SYA1_9ALTE|nr:flagellar biosynthetic protein FliQ [Agaribacter marinus]GLR70001.1 flagellar biosynthetic protein FliQ [Agaribacter marinus]